MSENVQLETPVLLLAMPQVLDPFFHHGVVLLVHHDDQGSFGFLVNRPTEIRIAEVLRGLEISWNGDPEALAFMGGPVEPQLGTVLYSRSDDGHRPEASIEVNEAVGLTQHLGDLSKLARDPPVGLRLFLGYAGWGEGQLMQEIMRNDWLTAPVSDDLLFAPEPESVWDAALRSVGADPALLPSWIQSGADQDPTN